MRRATFVVTSLLALMLAPARQVAAQSTDGYNIAIETPAPSTTPVSATAPLSVYGYVSNFGAKTTRADKVVAYLTFPKTIGTDSTKKESLTVTAMGQSQVRFSGNLDLTKIKGKKTVKCTLTVEAYAPDPKTKKDKLVKTDTSVTVFVKP